jgi:hypothetical protein
MAQTLMEDIVFQSMIVLTDFAQKVNKSTLNLEAKTSIRSQRSLCISESEKKSRELFFVFFCVLILPGNSPPF